MLVKCVCNFNPFWEEVPLCFEVWCLFFGFAYVSIWFTNNCTISVYLLMLKAQLTIFFISVVQVTYNIYLKLFECFLVAPQSIYAWNNNPVTCKHNNKHDKYGINGQVKYHLSRNPIKPAFELIADVSKCVCVSTCADIKWNLFL